jgi:hypothetical protein
MILRIIWSSEIVPCFDSEHGHLALIVTEKIDLNKMLTMAINLSGMKGS